MVTWDKKCDNCGAVYSPLYGPHVCLVLAPAVVIAESEDPRDATPAEIAADDRAQDQAADAREEARDERTDARMGKTVTVRKPNRFT